MVTPSGSCPAGSQAAAAPESAGKHRSGKTRWGNRWLRTALIEAALAASARSTTGAFAARYRRVMRHRGHKKTVVAVAHAILVTAYHLLLRHTTYQDPGTDYYDRRHAERGPPARDSSARTPGLPRHPRTRGLSARWDVSVIF